MRVPPENSGRKEGGMTLLQRPRAHRTASACIQLSCLSCEVASAFLLQLLTRFPTPGCAPGLWGESTSHASPLNLLRSAQLRTFPASVFLGVKLRESHRHAALRKRDVARNFFRKRSKLYNGGFISHASLHILLRMSVIVYRSSWENT